MLRKWNDDDCYTNRSRRWRIVLTNKRGICSRKCFSCLFFLLQFIPNILFQFSTSSLFIVMPCLFLIWSIWLFVWILDQNVKSLNRWEHQDGSCCWKISNNIAFSQPCSQWITVTCNTKRVFQRAFEANMNVESN